MKPSAVHFILFVVPFGLLAEPVSDLLPPQKRAETLILARKLLTSKSIDSSEESMAAMNPFNPIPPAALSVEAANLPAQVAAPVTVSDRELLKQIAEGVTPAGMMQLGDRTFLLVGKKKLKIGDHVSVTSDGIAYELEVTAIERTSFTLRLRNEEITRPIKSLVKKP